MSAINPDGVLIRKIREAFESFTSKGEFPFSPHLDFPFSKEGGSIPGIDGANWRGPGGIMTIRWPTLGFMVVSLIFSFASAANPDRIEEDISETPWACYEAAEPYLSESDINKLCSNGGTVATVDCYREAYRILNTNESIRLCRGGGDLRTVQCYREAYRQLNRTDALSLCQNRGNAETALCYRAAYKELSAPDSLRLCRNGGTLKTWECFKEARNHLELRKAINLCLLGEIIDVFVVAAEFFAVEAVADDKAVLDGHADVVGLDGEFAAGGFVEKGDHFERAWAGGEESGF